MCVPARCHVVYAPRICDVNASIFNLKFMFLPNAKKIGLWQCCSVHKFQLKSKRTWESSKTTTIESPIRNRIAEREKHVWRIVLKSWESLSDNNMNFIRQTRWWMFSDFLSTATDHAHEWWRTLFLLLYKLAHILFLSVGSLLAFRKLLEAENVNSATKHNNALNKFTIHTWARVIVVEWERLLWAAQLLPNFINSSVLSRLFWLCRVSRGERVVMLTIWLMLSS